MPLSPTPVSATPFGGDVLFPMDAGDHIVIVRVSRDAIEDAIGESIDDEDTVDACEMLRHLMESLASRKFDRGGDPDAGWILVARCDLM